MNLEAKIENGVETPMVESSEKVELFGKNTRTVVDVRSGLEFAGKNMVYGAFVWFFLSAVIVGLVESLLGLTPESSIGIEVFVVCLILLFIQSAFIYRANSSYKMDFETGWFRIPASDVEMSLLQKIILKPYWNLMFTRDLHVSQLENMYLNNERKEKKEGKSQTIYNLNITGEFGSAKLSFTSRQKRDEVRNNFEQLSKKYNNGDIGFQVAELS